MANQLALRVLARPGTEVLCAARAHVFRYEAAAAAWNSAVQLHPFPDDDGLLDAGRSTRRPGTPATTPAGCLADRDREHAHADVRAAVAQPRRSRPSAAVADTHGIALHCDGARHLERGGRARRAGAGARRAGDTVMFCVSKGLGAPVGSLLCGPRDVIREARVHRQRLGGGMRQAGVIAAAGLVALDSMIDRLADDHRRARRLAEASPIGCRARSSPTSVETNIVCASPTASRATCSTALDAEGIRAGTIDTRTVRFVTHKDVDDADIDRVLKTFERIDPRRGRGSGGLADR